MAIRRPQPLPQSRRAHVETPKVTKRVKHTPESMAITIRNKRIFEARVRGKSLEDIAEQYGLAVSTIEGIISERMARYRSKEGADVEQLRAVEMALLDKMQDSIYDMALSGSKDHVTAIIALHDRRVRLRGLATPEKTVNEHTGVVRIYHGVDPEEI